MINADEAYVISSYNKNKLVKLLETFEKSIRKSASMGFYETFVEIEEDDEQTRFVIVDVLTMKGYNVERIEDCQPKFIIKISWRK